MKLNITTHDGSFHPDEVIACALVRRGLDCTITRTRDVDIIAKADITLDVGGVHNPEMGQYDHHQFKTDDDKYGMSSAGLIYETMGLNGTYLDAFIKHVDSRDTRVNYDAENPYDEFCKLVIKMNDINIIGAAQDDKFNTCVLAAQVYIQQLIDGIKYPTMTDFEELAAVNEASKEAEYTIRAHCIVSDGVATYGEWFPEWKDVVGDELFVTHGDKPREYKIMCNTDVMKITSSQDEVFTHIGGFISVIKPTDKNEAMVTVLQDGEAIDIHFSPWELRLKQREYSIHYRVGHTQFVEVYDHSSTIYNLDFSQDDGLHYVMSSDSGDTSEPKTHYYQ